MSLIYQPTTAPPPHWGDAHKGQAEIRQHVEAENNFKNWVVQSITTVQSNIVNHLNNHDREEVQYRKRLQDVLKAIALDLSTNNSFASMMPNTMRVVAGMAIKDMEETDGDRPSSLG